MIRKQMTEDRILEVSGVRFQVSDKQRTEARKEKSEREMRQPQSQTRIAQLIPRKPQPETRNSKI